jgi:ABC-type nitrate/sulfonate/bicarbonate transport system permease component
VTRRTDSVVAARARDAVIGMTAMISLIAIWHLWVSTQDVNALLMPSPRDVATELYRDPAPYWDAVVRTTAISVSGLAFGTLLGGVLAVMCWISRVATGLISAAVLLLRSVPIIILIPLLTRTMGYETGTTLTIVTLISFFPAFVLVSSGLRALPPSASDVVGVLGGTKWQRLTLLALPASIPSLAGAVRMSSGGCVLAAMVTEFLTGADGIGNIFLLANADLATERAWAASVLAAVMSVVIFRAAGTFERLAQERMN